MKDSGKITKPVDSASSLITMVTSMKEIGTMTKQMDMVSISILMGRSIEVFGLMICSMAQVLKTELMAQNFKENTNSATNRDLDYMSKKMARTFSVNGKTINLRAQESTSGAMDVLSKDHGPIARWMGWEYICGMTTKCTLAITRATRCMAMVCLILAKDKSMQDIGGMDSSMGYAPKLLKLIRPPNMACGKTENSYNGSQKKNMNK